jgi:hypothetical protein
VGGHIDVTQRLKRRNTIIGKLTREPSMEVTQFHDIGGGPGTPSESLARVCSEPTPPQDLDHRQDEGLHRQSEAFRVTVRCM